MSLSKVDFKCDVCDETHNFRDLMVQHVLEAHTSGIARTTCTVCTKKFKTKQAVICHMMQCHVSIIDDRTCTRDLYLVVDRDFSNLSHREICMRIANFNDMECVFVSGIGGSCQYLAVLEGLRACGYPHVDELTVGVLRGKAASEIEKNQDDYKESMTVPVSTYCHGVRSQQWGDNLTLQALSNVLKFSVQVYVFTEASQYVFSLRNVDSNYQLYLTLDSRNENTAHYDALILRRASSPAVPASEIPLCLDVQSDVTTLPTILEVEQLHTESLEMIAPVSTARRSTRLSTKEDTEDTREQCEYCKRKFKDLASHKTCPKRDLSDTESLRSASSMSSVGSRRSARIAIRTASESPVPGINQQTTSTKEKCLFCKRSYSSLAAHKICKKRDEYYRNTVASVPTNGNCCHRLENPLVSSFHTGITASHSGFVEKSLLAADLKKKLQQLSRENIPWTKAEMASADPMYLDLQEYHDYLNSTVDNLVTEKVSKQVADVIDVEVMESQLQERGEARPFTWSDADESKLNKLTESAKSLVIPKFPWSAPLDSTQGKYNHSRFRFLIEEQLRYRLLKCPQCSVTTLLVGLDEIGSELCMQCLELNRKRKETRAKFEKAWCKVKPDDKVIDLPTLSPAEQALISLVQPIVTIKKLYLFNRKYKQECINLLHNVNDTWCKVLPRSDLQDRFIIVERRFKADPTTKYMIADPSKIRIWLQFLFQNHSVYMRKVASNEIELSEAALTALEAQSELASVDNDERLSDAKDVDIDKAEQVPPSAELHTGLSKEETYSFDNYPYLYLSKEHALRVTKSGTIEVIADENPARQPLYDPHIPVSVMFPTLYPHGENAPTDCGEHSMARWLLKKQSQFAQTTSDGRLQWTHGEHGVHMMHEYARLVEMNVRSLVGWYLNENPENSHLPVQSIVDAFKEGMNDDKGAIDSKMPGLQGLMTRIRNSREKMFAERLGIETIGRDLSDANVFMTLNMDVRAWKDVRKLLFELQEGTSVPMPDDYFESDTEKFTELLDRFATQVAVYLSKKAELFAKTFFDICGIKEERCGVASTHPDDRTESSWWFGRVEFTKTRGCCHFHFLAKLPGVLDTAILSKVIQDMRVVRSQLKYSNITDYDRAWHIIRMGLLATRYLVLFADSVSTSAFFTEPMGVDHFDETKVIDVDALRSDFQKNYVLKNINKSTHPIMRQFNDPECFDNINKEMAAVASVSCIHDCIPNICGGDSKGKNCRFSFPMKKLKYTVVGLIDVLDNQMEAHVLHRRTSGRVANLQPLFLQYWRANHDITTIIDASHKLRYATKYVSKSGQIDVLLNDVIQNVEDKGESAIIAPNVKHVLSQLLLADCSHRTYMTKQELAYYVMDLPQVIRSFATVKTVAHYPRATVVEDAPYKESGVVELSDRSDYSAYSERTSQNTVTKSGLTADMLKGMSLRDFSETVNFRWAPNTSTTPSQPRAGGKTRKWRTRDKLSGHWVMSLRKRPIHVRSSTVLYTDLAKNYVPDDNVDRFVDLPRDRQNQLKRAYQELIMYEPWTTEDPDDHFLSPEVVAELKKKDADGESRRYSLRRLTEYWNVYMDRVEKGLVAPPGSKWHRDNVYSYTMYLTTRHNQCIRQDRVENDGVFVAQYEAADELEDTEVEIRPNLVAETDNDEYPSLLNFLSTDFLTDVEIQDPPTVGELSVAFPENRRWSELKKKVTQVSSSLFMCRPEKPSVPFSSLTPMQAHAVELIRSGREKILYIYGKAGSGKTVIASWLLELFGSRAQAAAGTGRAAANMNAPTIYGAFLWSAQGLSSVMSEEKIQKLRNFYENTDLFIFDEINACGADILAMIDSTMSQLFGKEKSKKGKQPFGGKSVVFLGDSGQLRPVRSAAIYDKSVVSATTGYRSQSAKKYLKNAQRGQKIYTKYLVPKCVFLRQGKRNSGLLQMIVDRLRDGKHTEEDLNRLTLLRRRYPDYVAERGMHYSNESACRFNCYQLWGDCKAQKRRFYACRAVYHFDDRNNIAVRMLSAIPASDFGYAPDVLCLSPGCEVRLIRNVDTSAGLVTNSTGRVVEIMYDNRDVPSLLKGQYPTPYCIVVWFPRFSGFEKNEGERFFPFENHQLVPLYHDRFTLDKVPNKLVKLLKEAKFCYRRQFPIDLSTNLTAHRGQGQTWRDCTLSVNLGFESPDCRLPDDATSVTYVACTRITTVDNLFLSPIHPDAWAKMGNTDRDVYRRKHEETLKKAAEKFALETGKIDECSAEMLFSETYDDVDAEWERLTSLDHTFVSKCMLLPDDELQVLRDGLLTNFDDRLVRGCLTPVENERFIGIDQGLKTFSIVAVDKKPDGFPRVVGAVQLDLVSCGILDRGKRFRAIDVLMVLRDHSPLYEWIQSTDDDSRTTLSRADRVIVLLEQIAAKNKYFRQFGQELGKALQRDFDVDKCVVKMSQPHLHRPNGPVFKLGTDVVKMCDEIRRRASGQPASSDVEPSDSSSDDASPAPATSLDYKTKKALSSAVFKYFVSASPAQQTAMQVEVDIGVQRFWTDCTSVKKHDDLGDALLHALDELLCGSSNYHQLLPPSTALQRNRTVVLVVLQNQVCWVTLECVLNEFVIQDFGMGDIPLLDSHYSDAATNYTIRSNLPSRLASALQEFDTVCTFLSPTDFIQVVVKQLKKNTYRNLSSKAAGALTNSAVHAMMAVGNQLLPDGKVTIDSGKKIPWRFSRQCKTSGRRFVVTRSAGKHLNAVLSCLQWMKSNLPDFVRDRPFKVGNDGKDKFYCALRNAALNSKDDQSARLESIRLSPNVVQRLRSAEGMGDNFTRKVFADLILIALNNNQQYVRALSDNYRQQAKH